MMNPATASSPPSFFFPTRLQKEHLSTEKKMKKTTREGKLFLIEKDLRSPRILDEFRKTVPVDIENTKSAVNNFLQGKYQRPLSQLVSFETQHKNFSFDSTMKLVGGSISWSGTGTTIKGSEADAVRNFIIWMHTDLDPQDHSLLVPEELKKKCIIEKKKRKNPRLFNSESSSSVDSQDSDDDDDDREEKEQQQPEDFPQKILEHQGIHVFYCKQVENVINFIKKTFRTTTVTQIPTRKQGDLLVEGYPNDFDVFDAVLYCKRNDRRIFIAFKSGTPSSRIIKNARSLNGMETPGH